MIKVLPMIRMIQSKSAAHAKDYFTDALLKADYYLNDQEIKGQFHGKLAERLGIAGPATKEVFFPLCENRHPLSATPLTPRTKRERTVGYDINFHAPKSVSIVHSLSGDAHILNAFQQCVTETMQDIEADSMTRVRKNGRDEDRATGELVWVDFIHQTARPTEGHTPDCHLHAHCYAFNLTYDQDEGRTKAAQFRFIKRDMPYYQAMFHKRFSDRLTDLGYQIRRTGKSFEIEGVPQQVIDLFSKRTDEIGRVAKEKGVTSAAKLAELGAKTRAAKQKGHTMEELRQDWKAQIRALGDDATESRPLRYAKDRITLKASPDKCVDHALQHCFERASVMAERRVLESAFRYSIGRNGATVRSVAAHMKEDARIIRVQEKGEWLCTTREVLQEERRMVRLAQAGIGKLNPIYSTAPELTLNGQQADAVKEVLTTGNRVSIIRGAAGAGKTTLMREAIDMIEKKGIPVTVVAPTAKASRGVLQDEGFHAAETVATLLVSKELQEQLNNGVLWVDEAGLLGTKDMADILDIAAKQNARVILGGDTRQHASVVRGDALRILNTVGGIKTAEVNKIYRQKDLNYRSAVAELAKGNIKEGFDKLDAMGAIRQTDPLRPTDMLVDEYLSALKSGKSALVISPTHKQSDEVTAAIRQRLRKEGMLGRKEVSIDRLTNTNMTGAEKNDWRNYKPGQVIQFNQNLPGVRRGSLWSVHQVAEQQVILTGSAGRTLTLPDDKGDKFDVFEVSKIGVSKGDMVQITRNGFDRQDKRLNNGQEFRVARVSVSGDILLQNPISKALYSIGQDYGHLAHAHCITSHASQGKTVDAVFVSQPGSTFGATDAKQFYVSVSRAREKVVVYTDDKEELLAHAARLGDRQSAIELTTPKDRHLAHLKHLERTKEMDRANQKDQIRNIDGYDNSSRFTLNFDDYEPRL